MTQAHANAGARPPTTTVHWRNVLIWSSVGILVGTEAFGAALAAAWAAGGLLGLGTALQTALYAIAIIGAASIMVPFMRRAAIVDPLTASEVEEQP